MDLNPTQHFINYLSKTAPLQFQLFEKLRAAAPNGKLSYLEVAGRLGHIAPERIALVFEEHIRQCLHRHFNDATNPAHERMRGLWLDYCRAITEKRGFLISGLIH